MRAIQSGQAISEFLVAMLWLVPFALGFYTLAQMWNVQITTSKAARFMAWERTAYDNAGYQAKLNDPTNGFGAEITKYFFEEGGKGFGTNSSGTSREWKGWKTGQSMVDLTNGAAIQAPSATDTFKNDANSYLDSRMGRISWMKNRGGVELNTASGAILTVPYSQADVYTLADSPAANPRATASYMLISDSWAPGSEQIYSDRVGEVQSKLVSGSHRLFLNSAFTRFAAGTFEELNQKLYVNQASPRDSFNMVSPTQSTALPSGLGYYSE